MSPDRPVRFVASTAGSAINPRIEARTLHVPFPGFPAERSRAMRLHGGHLNSERRRLLIGAFLAQPSLPIVPMARQPAWSWSLPS